MEPDTWMRKAEDDNSPHYECIAVHVDDLLIASKTPQATVNLLTNDCEFKLKGTGPIKYHLGCDFSRDELHTLCFAPCKCIEKMSEACFSYFGSKPNTACASTLELGDHPELDDTPLLDQDGIQQYQSVVGTL